MFSKLLLRSKVVVDLPKYSHSLRSCHFQKKLRPACANSLALRLQLNSKNSECYLDPQQISQRLRCYHHNFPVAPSAKLSQIVEKVLECSCMIGSKQVVSIPSFVNHLLACSLVVGCQRLYCCMFCIMKGLWVWVWIQIIRFIHVILRFPEQIRTSAQLLLWRKTWKENRFNDCPPMLCHSTMIWWLLQTWWISPSKVLKLSICRWVSNYR